MKKINAAFFMVAMVILMLCISVVSAHEDVEQDDNTLTCQLSEDNTMTTIKTIDNNKLMDKKSKEALVNGPDLDRQKEHSEVDDSTEKVNERRNNEQYDKNSRRHIKSSDETSTPDLIRASSSDRIGVGEEIDVELIIDDYYMVYTNETVNGFVSIDGVETGNVLVDVYINNTKYNTTTSDDGQFTVNFMPQAKASDIEVYAVVKTKTSDVTTTNFVGDVIIDLVTNNTTPVDVEDYIAGEVYVEYEDERLPVISGTKVTIKINGTEYTTTSDDEGEFMLAYTPENAGTLPVIVNVYEAEETAEIEVTGIDTKFLVANDAYVTSVISGQPFAFNATLVDVDGNPVSGVKVHVLIESSEGRLVVEKDVTTNDNGYFKADTIIANETGDVYDYYGYAKFDGNNKYNPSELYSEELEQGYIWVVIEPDEGYIVNLNEQAENTFVYGETVSFTGDVTKDEEPVTDGEVEIYVNDELVGKAVLDDEGQFSLDYTPETTGEFTVVAVYNGYNSEVDEFEVVKAEVSIEIDEIDPVKVGNNVTITGTITNNNVTDVPVANEDITVSVNCAEYIVTTDDEGKFTLEIPTEIGGTNNITVEIADSELYEDASEDSEFEVVKQTPTISIETTDAKAGQNTTINGTVTDEDDNPVANTPVRVEIGNGIYETTTDDKGNYNVTAPVQAGKNPITVKINETATTEAATEETSITADKQKPNITSEATPAKAGQNTTINGTVTDEDDNPVANAPVRIEIGNGIYETTTDDKGNYEVQTPVQAGKNPITVKVNETATTEAATEETSITADKQKPNITSEATPAKAGQNTTINGTVTDEDDNPVANTPVRVEIGNGIYETTTDDKGNYNVTAPVQAGKNPITVKINETATTKSATKNITIAVKKQESTTTAVLTNNTARNVTLTVNVTDKITKQPITRGNIEVINMKTKKKVANAVITGANTTLITSLNESGSYNLTVKFMETEIYNTSQCTLNNVNVQKRAVTLTLTTINNTVNNTAVNITVSDKTSGKKIANAQIRIILPNKTTINATTDSKGMLIQSLTLPAGKNILNVTYIGSKTYSNTSKSNTIDVKKITTKTTINTVTAYLGDEITLTAKVTASNAIAVNNGNVIFKLNGVTIKDNCKLSGSDNPLKIKVVNGVATATITADSSMRNANQITAHYIENTDYTASNSTTTKITPKPRTATIIVTTNTKKIKQGQNLTITAKIYDTTGGKKTTNLISSGDDFVYFKINGVTLKDANGQMIKVKVVNGVATINYTVPLGLSCVTDTKTMTPKNHTILAVYYNKNYADNIKNTTTFQLERSDITINLVNATINNKTHTLSMKITIKDYLGNVVTGPNKLIIKVNGVTLKNGTHVQYFYTTDGILNLKNIPVPASKNYATIEVITQDRLAYESQRNSTTKIKITN